MKKSLLSFFIAVLISFTAISQTTFTDNFDQDTAGKFLAKNDPAFTTWSHSPGGADDILVSGVKSHSAPNSVYFASTLSPGGPSDIVLPFTGAAYNTGNFSFSMWMFVDTGKKGYFNFQEQTTVGKGWSFEANFDSIGNLTFTNTTSGTLLTVSYPQNSWYKIEIRVNLNNNNWQIFINNNLSGSFTNSYRAIASVDIYAMTNSSFYVDDVSYTYAPYTKPALNAALTYIDKVSGYLATQTAIPQIEIRNLGTQIITSASVQINYNGITKTKTVSGLNLLSLSYDTIIMDPIVLTGGSKPFNATILQVNGGADNDTTDNSKTIYLNPVVPALGKFVIAEESTGTWCQWCPRGAVFLKTLEEKYNGLFQGIAVHNNDPMIYGNYDKGMTAPSYPNVRVDRGAWFDPSAMETDVLNRLMLPPSTMIKSGAIYYSGSSMLNISLTTKFTKSVSGNYKIVCVLVEDSVTGTASNYNQANAYSGGANGVMGGFELLSNPVPASKMVYDHVGRVIYPNFGGLPNAFNPTVNAGDSFVHNFLIWIDPSWKLSKMHIVGFVIDPSGKIDNGSSTDIETSIANGFVAGTAVTSVKRLDMQTENINVYPNPVKQNLHISLPTNSNSQVQIYDISGKLMNQLNDVNENEISIDTQTLPMGIYMVHIINGDQVLNKKFIKE